MLKLYIIRRLSGEYDGRWDFRGVIVRWTGGSQRCPTVQRQQNGWNIGQVGTKPTYIILLELVYSTNSRPRDISAWHSVEPKETQWLLSNQLFIQHVL